MAWNPKGNIKGPQGIAGPPGSAGPQGPAGNTGSQGPAGATGPQGTPGEKWSSGGGPPVGTAPGPIIGDWYLDTNTGDVYEKTSGTGWTLRGNIKGSKGDPGPTGAQGTQGPAGATGATGPQGATGAQGPQGVKGDPGATGATGPQGPIGNTGPQGIQGPTGQAGLGVPAGGVTGAILRKKSGTDNDTEWKPLASLQTAAVSNAGTTSTTGVMAGLGKDIPAVITPTATGKVLITLTGSVYNNTAAGLVNAVQLRFGTGAAPANNAAAIGTAVGGIASRGAMAAALGFVPLCLMAVVTGLAIGTPVWLDVVYAASGGGTVILSNVAFTAVELP